MKKFLLLVSSMLAITCLVAQDVYVGGFKDGKPVVYKNGSLLYQTDQYGDDEHMAVAVNHETDDVYWIKAYRPDFDWLFDVMKNDSPYLETHLLPADANAVVNDLGIGYNNKLYSAGACYDQAVVWLDDDPFENYALGSSYLSSAANGIHVIKDVNGDLVYTCGVAYLSGSQYGVVWRNNDPEPIIAVENESFIDVYYYNDHLYILGQKAVYIDEDLVFDLPDINILLMYSDIGDIVVYGEDIYFTFEYQDGNGNMMASVYKNNELLYSNNLNDCFGSHFGVYSGGVIYNSFNSSHKPVIYNNNEVLFTINSEYMPINDICVVEKTDNNVRTLPYFEGFEMGDTDWMGWTKTDEMMNVNEDGSDAYPSYWQISNEYQVSGNYCAKHYYNGNFEQEGWLISPKIHINSGMEAILEFETYERWPDDMQYEGVWLSTTGTSPNNFSEIWTQNDASQEWKNIHIDLSAYAGQNIYLAFKYKGNNGHAWYIDDVNITEFLGVEDFDASHIAVYPNPVNDVIYINGVEDETVSVYDAMGRLVMQQVYAGSLDVSGLSKGVYAITTGNGMMRFVKK
ncbi:MAG: choice-of-anchor J domain-containing protein [Bacteroidales bacterium]|nr:choice-of-anchor J domain-containing protein [Bacteroidales bacterium]